MKVLSIGNSFSQDAQRYLHQIADADGEELKCVNLMIGGCPLRLHYLNCLDDKKAYSFEFNGEPTGIFVSVREALVSDEWDVITLQQVSHQSPYFDTYFPYLPEVAEYVKKYAPKSKIMMHQTWAYEQGSKRLCDELGYRDQAEMFADIEDAYAQAAEMIGADGILPSGQAMQYALENGKKTVHRDTFHADLGFGRYLLGLTWYGILTGNRVTKNKLRRFDVPVSETDIAIAQESAREAIADYR